jgi:superfamily II DNA/RNA helicase
MSSPAAAQAALKARLERLVEKYEQDKTDYSADIYDPTELESIVDIVPSHVISDSQDSISNAEKKKLRELSNQVKNLNEESDTKIKKATEEIKILLKEGYKPIVFCRFIATADYVAKELKNRLSKDHPTIHVVSVTGSLSEEEREIQIEELSKSPVRVLVATDCLSEGINMQDHFNAVLHYDLPWNPNRLEQREGRVDRFGQKSEKVKAIILFGADNPIDGAVLDVLLRKAKKIHKTLKISVPIPVDSENVLEAVLKALFWKSSDKIQMSLFDDRSTLAEVHRKWDRAADKEKKSRSLFAQHSIKPGEVALELEKTDHVLGSPEVVHRFVRSAMQRLNSPIIPSNGHWKFDLNNLPDIVKTKLLDLKIKNITFEQPDKDDVSYITRNHVLTNSLAEYLFEKAFNSNGKSNVAARSSVIRSDQVDKTTTFLLLRLRHLIKKSGREKTSLAEECIVVGFKGLIGSHEWMELEQAEREFELIMPAENISDSDKRYWLNQVLNQFKELESYINEVAQTKAVELINSYERLRKSMNSEKVIVQPLLPVDVLALVVILPKPRI